MANWHVESGSEATRNWSLVSGILGEWDGRLGNGSRHEVSWGESSAIYENKKDSVTFLLLT